MLRPSQPISLPFSFITTGVTNEDNYGFDLEGHAAADLGYFAIPFKCSVFEVHVGISENFAGTSGETEIRFDRRFTIGSDTGRSDADVARLILGATAGASSQGDQVYDRAGAGVTLEPGMEVVVQLLRAPTGTGQSGKIRTPQLVVLYEPEKRSNVSGMQETA